MVLFSRYVIVQFTAAEPEKVLSKLMGAHIDLSDMDWKDTLTVQIRIKYKHLSAVKKLFEKDEINYSVISKNGILWYLQNAFSRPVLLVGFIIFAMLSVLLPGRVLFIEIIGNETVPDEQLMGCLEDCGVYFGMRASDLRSERIKNQLLGNIPELQWVGVTASGCVATIHVEERSDANYPSQKENAVSSIVAAVDGIISEMTVYRGNPLFRIGQSVKAGETIISGYTDCGIKTIAQQADGEVYAYTRRNCSVQLPVSSVKRGTRRGKRICYRLHIGKKVINLCNHSGISDSSCVKMYSEYYWPLTGELQLPLSLVKVTYSYYDMTENTEITDTIDWMSQYAREYLESQMVAGNILSESLDWYVNGDVYELACRYACHEMIGQEKYEENIRADAEDG